MSTVPTNDEPLRAELHAHSTQTGIDPLLGLFRTFRAIKKYRVDPSMEKSFPVPCCKNAHYSSTPA